MNTTINSSSVMQQERLYQIILQQVVSEKTTRAADKYQQITFQVIPDASKKEIKEAVETLFKVKVEKVQVANMRGKVKRFGRTPGRRKNWKKAHVRLEKGSDIDLLGMMDS